MHKKNNKIKSNTVRSSSESGLLVKHLKRFNENQLVSSMITFFGALDMVLRVSDQLGLVAQAKFIAHLLM